MAVKKMNINVVHYSKLIDRKKNLINEFKKLSNKFNLTKKV